MTDPAGHPAGPVTLEQINSTNDPAELRRMLGRVQQERSYPAPAAGGSDPARAPEDTRTVAELKAELARMGSRRGGGA
jgi:hypothetical protein